MIRDYSQTGKTVNTRNRVRTLSSSSNSITFHDLFYFSMTLGLAVTFKYFQSSTKTNSGIHQNACGSRCSIAPLYLKLSLPCQLLFAATTGNLPNKTLIFHEFQGPKIKFHDFPGLGNEVLTLHYFPGFPWPVRTLQKYFWNVIVLQEKKAIRCEKTKLQVATVIIITM